MTAEVETHSIQAEQALLGAILNQNEAMTVVESLVDAEHFFEPLHRSIFGVCQQMIAMGKRVNPVTIRSFLPAGMQIGAMTLGEYLARLAAEAVTIIHAPDYARTVRDFADRRAIAEVAHALMPRDGVEPSELAQWGIEQLDAIATARSTGHVGGVGMQEATTRAIDSAAEAYKRDGALSGIPTGLRDLDRKTLGLKRGHVYVLAGRPGQGKTTVALAAARNQAKAGFKVRFESLEMDAVDLTQRMIADECFENYRLPYFKLASGNFREDEFREVGDAGRVLERLPIRIETPLSVTVSQICARARIWQRRHGLDVLYVDHLGYIRLPGRGNHVTEVGDAMKALKGLARELDIPVVVLCQLSRGVEGREDKRPVAADLRASGNIEEDADTIIMVYREAFYLERREPKVGTPEHIEWQNALEAAYNKMQCIVEKQRQGPVGAVVLYCDIACNAVRNGDFVAQHRRVSELGQEVMKL